MMLPELQDIADFDAPRYGQDLGFLEADIEDVLFGEDEELGRIPKVSGTVSPFTRARAPRRGAGSLQARTRAGVAPTPTPTKRLPIIRSATPTKRRMPAKRAPITRAERIGGLVERGVKEYREKKATEVDPNHLRLAKEDALNSIASRIKADLMPKLNAIYNMIDRSSLQTSATNEHNVIMNTQAYRRKVLGDLLRIAHQLPKGHPLRAKIQAKRRSLGLF